MIGNNSLRERSMRYINNTTTESKKPLLYTNYSTNKNYQTPTCSSNTTSTISGRRQRLDRYIINSVFITEFYPT